MNNCIKCGKQISKTSKSKKYCSPMCGKLYLKAQYKKRNRGKINAYNKKYRKTGIRISGYYEKVIRPNHLRKQPRCQKCNTAEDLQVAHVKPRNKGGTHVTLITLCRKHHHEFDNILRAFWK